MYLTPCPTCGEPIIFDGKAWDRDGFPYPHGCVVEVHVPNEKEFCGTCGGYTQGKACEECPKRKRASAEGARRPGGVDSHWGDEI